MINIIAFGYNWTFEKFLKKSRNKKNIRILHVFLPKNRKEKLQPTINICKKLGLNWSIPENKDVLLEEVKNIRKENKIDVGVVAAYMMILPKEVLQIPKFGVINLHPSLLPKHRGAHPINWAIIQGDKYTGCTVHYMTEDVDKGNIILQKKIEIYNHDISYLAKELAEIGSNLLWKSLELFEKTAPKGKIQDESEATTDPARKPEDGEIRQDFSAQQAERLIRALAKPWPGAFVKNEGKKFIIFNGELIKSSSKVKKYISEFGLQWKGKILFLILKDGKIKITKWQQKD